MRTGRPAGRPVDFWRGFCYHPAPKSAPGPERAGALFHLPARSESMPSGQTRKLILAALFAALTAIGAFIRIPLPYVPVTLQVLFVTFAGLFLGPRYGALSQLVYIGVGLSGIPIFAKGGGISYVLQPSFGFLVGFVPAAWSMGAMFERSGAPTFKNAFIAAIFGQLFIYGIGLPYLYFMNNFYLSVPLPIEKLIWTGFSLFAVSGLLSAAVAARVTAIVHPRVARFL